MLASSLGVYERRASPLACIPRRDVCPSFMIHLWWWLILVVNLTGWRDVNLMGLMRHNFGVPERAFPEKTGASVSELQGKDASFRAPIGPKVGKGRCCLAHEGFTLLQQVHLWWAAITHKNQTPASSAFRYGLREQLCRELTGPQPQTRPPSLAPGFWNYTPSDLSSPVHPRPLQGCPTSDCVGRSNKDAFRILQHSTGSVSQPQKPKYIARSYSLWEIVLILLTGEISKFC